MTQLTNKKRIEYAALTATEFMRVGKEKCVWCNSTMEPDFLDNTTVPIVDGLNKQISTADVRGARGFFCTNCPNCETL